VCALLAGAVAPHRKKSSIIFERGENLLQNSVLHFAFMFRQTSERGLVLKGLIITYKNNK